MLGARVACLIIMLLWILWKFTDAIVKVSLGKYNFIKFQVMKGIYSFTLLTGVHDRLT